MQKRLEKAKINYAEQQADSVFHHDSAYEKQAEHYSKNIAGVPGREHELKAFMGERLHTDFTDVAVYRKDMTEGAGYTQNGTVYLNRDLKIGSSLGRTVFAHELVHVLQQGAVKPEEGMETPLLQAPYTQRLDFPALTTEGDGLCGDFDQDGPEKDFCEIWKDYKGILSIYQVIPCLELALKWINDYPEPDAERQTIILNIIKELDPIKNQCELIIAKEKDFETVHSDHAFQEWKAALDAVTDYNIKNWLSIKKSRKLYEKYSTIHELPEKEQELRVLLNAELKNIDAIRRVTAECADRFVLFLSLGSKGWPEIERCWQRIANLSKVSGILTTEQEQNYSVTEDNTLLRYTESHIRSDVHSAPLYDYHFKINGTEKSYELLNSIVIYFKPNQQIYVVKPEVILLKKKKEYYLCYGDPLDYENFFPCGFIDSFFFSGDQEPKDGILEDPYLYKLKSEGRTVKSKRNINTSILMGMRRQTSPLEEFPSHDKPEWLPDCDGDFPSIYQNSNRIYAENLYVLRQNKIAYAKAAAKAMRTAENWTEAGADSLGDMLRNQVDLNPDMIKALTVTGGFIIGESHNSAENRDMLSNAFQQLKGCGVTTIYVEHFIWEQYQSFLDAQRSNGLAGDVDAYELSIREHTFPDYVGLYRLLLMAKIWGIRVMCLSSIDVWTANSSEQGGIDRLRTLNVTARDIVQHDEKKRNGSYVILCGRKHVHNQKGETKRAPVPGISELLNIPAITKECGELRFMLPEPVSSETVSKCLVQ